MSFALGVFVGGIIGTIVVAVLASGAQSDDRKDYHAGYQNGLTAGRLEATAKRQLAGRKAAETRRAKS